MDTGLRDVLVRPTGLGLAAAVLLQSLSSTSGSRGGPMSPRPRRLPNLLLSSEGAVEGLNFPPIVQTSSLSAAPIWPSGVVNPDPFRLNGGASDSVARPGGRLERQSFAPSDREG